MRKKMFFRMTSDITNIHTYTERYDIKVSKYPSITQNRLQHLNFELRCTYLVFGSEYSER